MDLSSFKKWNNILGWFSFLVALVVYTLTVEPTVSFWDCGEYIATSVKLQVPHPPGAPLFQMIGAVTAGLAFGNVMNQAFWVNMISVISSALSVLFLFWTITALARRLAGKVHSFDRAQAIAVFGSGLVGALVCTFSDTFWFSAVEGEVYALSSMLTAMAYWAVLKWEEEYGVNPRANRWLVLIFYIIGLSIGVHILVFLTVPAIGMIYYFKTTEKVDTKKFIIGNLISLVALGIIFKGIIPTALFLFGKLEIFFVNSLGFPLNSGTMFAVLLIGAAIWYGLRWAKSKDMPRVHSAILGVMFILIGYSTFLMLAIRSGSNPPIDENNPEDALSLLAYYNREQYGDWPILYGNYFNSELDRQQPYTDGTPVYSYDEELEKYVITDDRKGSVPNYDKSTTGFFPRMWSPDPDHVKNYVKIAGLRNDKQKPSVAQNFKFFMDYQVGQMWWRYFMWNFSGRQNDDQNHYELTQGNWISGITFLDEMRLGPQKNLPGFLSNSPARNTYFLLPFILGFIGMYYHFSKHKQDAWTVLLFFLFTGLAIVMYTNHKPFEPRERDYAFVGSFYVFAIWVGLGALALFEMMKEKFKTPAVAYGLTAVLLLAVPGRMASQNWDDHTRANRYAARDMARSYLDSCAPNSILFTNGDNDTFPLWYVQEVEGYRTDVRIINLSLLNTDWYIDQMKRAAYDSKPVPFSFEHNQYVQGTRDVVYFRDMGFKGRIDAKDFVGILKSDDPRYLANISKDKRVNTYPTKNLRLAIDKEAVLAKGVVSPEDSSRIVDYIDWDLGGNYLAKRDMMVVDLIANNNWDRPIYFSITVGSSPGSFFWLTDYFRLEGLAYRFVPIKAEATNKPYEYGEVDQELMYANLMEKFQFGNVEAEGVYLDETVRRMSFNYRSIYGRLAQDLAASGDNDRAEQLLDRVMNYFPTSKFEFNYFIFPVIEGYYQAGNTEKARMIIEEFAADLDERIAYFSSFSGSKRSSVRQDEQMAVQFYQMLASVVQQYEIKENTQEALQRNDIYQRMTKAVGSPVM